MVVDMKAKKEARDLRMLNKKDSIRSQAGLGDTAPTKEVVEEGK